MRAMLVVNPVSTTASARTLEVLLAALEGELKLDVVETAYRGHARDVAAQARADELEVVIALGGDGTVNEVVNGLLCDGPAEHLPDLAVVPGGGTNVFARALGLPRDPVEATGELLTALRDGTRRSIGLGSMLLDQRDRRWFTFNAGLGWDAEVVATVDERRQKAPRLDGRPRTATIDYLRAAVGGFFLRTDRRHPALSVEVADPPLDTEPAASDGAAGTPGELTGLHLVMVANTAPWTYLGARAIGPFPEASFDHGLDLYALRTLNTLSTLRQARQVLSRRAGEPRGRAAVHRHDLAAFRVRAARPVAVQADGEPLGPHEDVLFRAVPDALRVVR